MKYPAIITKEGGFTLAEFPDCEGCQTYARKGESIEEAAQEALEGWLEANLGRDTIPNRPRSVAIPKNARVLEVPIPLVLEFRLELRWAREEAGKTQAQFGKNLGMSQQQYARLEGARSNPTLGTLDRVAKVAGLDVAVTRVSDSRIYSVKESRSGHGVIAVHSKRNVHTKNEVHGKDRGRYTQEPTASRTQRPPARKQSGQ